MKPIEKWSNVNTYELYCLYDIVPDKFLHVKKEKLASILLNGKCLCGCGLEIEK